MRDQERSERLAGQQPFGGGLNEPPNLPAEVAHPPPPALVDVFDRAVAEKFGPSSNVSYTTKPMPLEHDVLTGPTAIGQTVESGETVSETSTRSATRHQPETNETGGARVPASRKHLRLRSEDTGTLDTFGMPRRADLYVLPHPPPAREDHGPPQQSHLRLVEPPSAPTVPERPDVFAPPRGGSPEPPPPPALPRGPRPAELLGERVTFDEARQKQERRRAQVLEAGRRWRERNPGKNRQKVKDWRQRPEVRERLRAQERERYRDDAEYREHRKAQAREASRRWRARKRAQQQPSTAQTAEVTDLT